jgi:hypothetical protein
LVVKNKNIAAKPQEKRNKNKEQVERLGAGGG